MGIKLCALEEAQPASVVVTSVVRQGDSGTLFCDALSIGTIPDFFKPFSQVVGK
jgi:hypothetical protein